MTTRDSKGRFTKPCKVKAVKMAVKKFWCKYDTTIILMLMAFAIITGIFWLFGEKTTYVCEAGLEYHLANTSCVEEVPILSGRATWIRRIDETCVPHFDVVNNECKYKRPVHSSYSMIEVLGIEWNIVVSFVSWVLSHPVI